MRKCVLILMPVVFVFSAGCTTGRFGPKNVGEVTVAHTAGGVAVVVTARNTTVSGELLEASADHVLLMSVGKLVTVRYTDIRGLAPDDMPIIRNKFATPSAVQLARLKALSRFPAGILDSQLTALLADTKQSAPQEVK